MKEEEINLDELEQELVNLLQEIHRSDLVPYVYNLRKIKQDCQTKEDII